MLVNQTVIAKYEDVFGNIQRVGFVMEADEDHLIGSNEISAHMRKSLEEPICLMSYQVLPQDIRENEFYYI